MKIKTTSILKCSLFIIIPIVSVLLCLIFNIAQGEKNEEIVVGVLLGIVLDFSLPSCCHADKDIIHR